MIIDCYNDNNDYESYEHSYCGECQFVIDGDTKMATCPICGGSQPLDNLSVDGKLK